MEPGRSIVASAGTLYQIGTIKDIKGVRKYVAVVGGMGDNLGTPCISQYDAIIIID